MPQFLKGKFYDNDPTLHITYATTIREARATNDSQVVLLLCWSLYLIY